MELLLRNRHILITEILKKAELRSITHEQISPLLDQVLTKEVLHILSSQDNPKHLLKSAEICNLIKQVRSELRKRYGMFKLNKGRKADKLLDELEVVLKKKTIDSRESLDLHRLLLASHRSTQERLDAYSSLYEGLFAITGAPTSILDLACGLNPMSYPFMHLKSLTYHAREWAQAEVDLLKRYVDIVGLKGSVERADLLKERVFPEADICFLFKVIDVLENQRRGVAAELLSSIRAKYLIISFATKTLGGQPMRTKRLWFTKLIMSKGWTYKAIETENEIFYVVSLKKQ